MNFKFNNLITFTIVSSLSIVCLLSSKINLVNSQNVSATVTKENPVVEIKLKNLTIKLDGLAREEKKEFTHIFPKVTLFENNIKVIEVEGEPTSMPYSQIQIGEMDETNNSPEILFESYSGGAHCCTMALILTKQNNQWKPLKIGSFDGAPHGLSDVNQDGIEEYITGDDQFLYNFSSYAESFTPVQIWTLESGKIVNSTRSSRYNLWLRDELAEFLQTFDQNKMRSNGFWAGYVGWKALIGEEISAWQLMLKNYDQSQTYCTKYDQDYNCIGTQEKFPSALLLFLQQTNYLTEDTINKIKNLK